MDEFPKLGMVGAIEFFTRKGKWSQKGNVMGFVSAVNLVFGFSSFIDYQIEFKVQEYFLYVESL